MADRVMRMPEPGFIQRKCAHCEEEEQVSRKPLTSFIQKKGSESGTVASEAITSQIQATRGGGSSLPENTKSFMESRFGTDFSDVRIHSGDYAVQLSRELNAQAFTMGSDIYFNADKFAPESPEGKRLLAHELTHTVQQGHTQIHTKIQRTIGDGHDLSSPRMANNLLFQAIFDNQAIMEMNATGPEVRRLQQMLIDLGVSLPSFGADGRFGTETQNAVKEYQRRKGLVPDGRVGFRTIEAIDQDFPSFALPASRTAPWTMPCVLQILCPWNRNLVEHVLPTFNIITFDSRTFPIETWNGSTWVTSTFPSGGFRGGTNMGFLNTTTCQGMAFTIYHEGWHGQQPSSLTGVVESEKDAYINAEQWSIDIGLPGQGSFTNRVTGATENFRATRRGETAVNEPTAELFVRQEYGGVSATPGERILSRVGATDVLVRRPDGSQYTRPAAVGESVRGPVSMTNQRRIDPVNWVCP